MPTPATLERFVARVEEVAWQRREGERIAQETFFYDPAQRQAALARA